MRTPQLKELSTHLRDNHQLHLKRAPPLTTRRPNRSFDRALVKKLAHPALPNNYPTGHLRLT